MNEKLDPLMIKLNNLLWPYSGIEYRDECEMQGLERLAKYFLKNTRPQKPKVTVEEIEQILHLQLRDFPVGYSAEGENLVPLSSRGIDYKRSLQRTSQAIHTALSQGKVEGSKWEGKTRKE